MVSHQPSKFGLHRRCDSGGMMVLVCHVISLNHMIEKSCDFMGGSRLRQVIILSSLMFIGTVVVEICF